LIAPDAPPVVIQVVPRDQGSVAVFAVAAVPLQSEERAALTRRQVPALEVVAVVVVAAVEATA
jgi:hypothetical protein